MAHPSLIIEDGTGVDGADSFITDVEFDDIALCLFGHDETGSLVNKEAALRRAWYFMRSLDWLASSEYPTFGGTVPNDIKTAQAIYAHFELATPNILAPNVNLGQQRILTQVGQIGWTATGASGIDAQRTNVIMADDILKPYLKNNGVFLDRA